MYDYGSIQNNNVLGPQINISIIIPCDSYPKIEVDSIIDTGAVMTAIPIQIIQSLGEKRLVCGSKLVRGSLGTIKEIKSYYLNLRFVDCEFKNIEVLGLNKNYAVIGRDILNMYNIILNGPNRNWKVFS